MNRRIRPAPGLGGLTRALGAVLVWVSAPAIAGAQPAPGSFAAASRGEAYVHESWTVRDGLPVNAINGLLQSRDGYVWAVTFDGLVRFDGVRFTVFNSANSEGLPSNRLLGVLEARDGSLWLRTEQFHLVRFRNGVFTHFGPDHGLTDQVYTMYEDGSGVLWVGTSRGLGVIREERFVPIGEGTVVGPVESIVERSDGTVWLGTTASGLFRVADGQAAAVTAPAPLEAGMIRALYEDGSGTLWIGGASGIWTERGGTITAMSSSRPLVNVVRFLGSSASPAVFAYTQSGVFRIEAGVVSVVDGRNRILLSALLWADSDGMIWHATGHELYRNGSRVYALGADTGSELPPTTISAALLDHEGSLWLGTHAAGLHRLKPALFTVYSEPEGLAYRNVYAVYEDRSATVWVGTWGGGVSRIDTTGRITGYPTAPGFPSNVNSFYQDAAGRMWVGAADGLSRCDLSVCVPEGPAEIRGVSVLAIHGDRSGRIWVGTTAGLFRFAAGEWTRMPASAGTPSAPVRVFAEMRDGTLWLGTNGSGLVRYNGTQFTSVTTGDQLPSDVIRSLHHDADGLLWIGTEGRGLARLYPRGWETTGAADRRIVRFRSVDGLFDEMIHQILEDDFGRLWMSTNRGIFWVTRADLNAFAEGRTASIRSTGYSERDGLRNREANGGVQPAGMKASDGRLWFPTQDGVAVVDPSHIENRLPPPVVVERVVTSGAALLPDGTPLKLDVDMRDIQIEYTALSFVEPANVRFRYRLDPYDADWVDAGNRRTAFYTRVPPGRYTFRVDASHNEGVWNEAGAAVEFSVAPYLRETGVFRLLLVLLLAAAVAGVFRWRLLQLRQRARELERVVAERTGALTERERQLATQNAQLEMQAEQLHELDRAKSRFFANVSHEFRTPLTLTIGPLEDLRAKFATGDASARRPLDMALRNARRLLRLVNQILDVAKLEAGHMKLRRRTFDLVPFVRGIVSAFAAVADRNGVALTATTPDTVRGSFDSDALEKILTNLLSNAIKFTPAGGQVALALIQEGESIILRVSDSGPGIPAEHLPHVFERFYQVDESDTRAQPGTGIGLSLAKELVELHGGTIAVESEGEHSGAIFTVTLPLGYRIDADPALGTGDVEPAASEATASPGQRAAEAPDETTGSSEDVTTLLIVDDSADLRAYMREHFTSRFRVIEACDGAEGAALARAHLPDVVISDVMMPVADGHELCRMLRGSPETDFIPVILLTAQATTEHRIAGLERGADDFIVKPFEMRELEARVDNLIASRRRLRERFARGHVELRPRAAGVSRGDLEFIDRVRTAIEANLGDADFGVAELAKAVFQDRSHLFRRTRELLDESPSELIRRLRLARAEQLLGDESATVADVAYAVGFNSVSYFCRCFQETRGVTPAVYRGQLIPR